MTALARQGAGGCSSTTTESEGLPWQPSMTRSMIELKSNLRTTDFRVWFSLPPMART
ncbi:hypothetical protein PLANTIT3_61541 [Plantibacter sp. T3]|nr:hypothetical protein PLANTIT3_61541 [Plantibacter sp. T3]